MTDAEKNAIQEVVVGVAKLEGKVETLTARVEASMDCTQKATDTLFEFKDRHDVRISSVERTYVSQEKHDRDRDETRGDIKDMVKNIDGIKTRVTAIVAVATVAITFIQWMLK